MSTSENDNGAVESESKPLNDYVTSLVKEKYSLDASIHFNSIKLIDQGLYYRYFGPRSFGTQYVAVHAACARPAGCHADRQSNDTFRTLSFTELSDSLNCTK